METPNYPIAQIRAKLSQIVRRVHDTGEAVTITDRGKAVAILQPVPRPEPQTEEAVGLLGAKGALSDMPADEIDRMVSDIYRARRLETDRNVDI
ncbi:MAG: type II toxin-antitoxin system Phd/YefM family antitoxin [Desulfococcaceae bacterium]